MIVERITAFDFPFGSQAALDGKHAVVRSPASSGQALRQRNRGL